MPVEDLSEFLRQRTVLVGVGSDNGTGAFVAPGLVLTCAHVVRTEGGENRRIELRYLPGKFSGPAHIGWVDVNLDLALLQTDFTDHPILIVGGSAPSFCKVLAFGYSTDLAVGDPAALECEGSIGDGTYIKLKDSRVLPGMSGAPLLDPERLIACGLIAMTRNRSLPIGCFAVSGAAIASAFRDDPCRSSLGETAWSELLQAQGRAQVGNQPPLRPRHVHPLEPAPTFRGRAAELARITGFLDSPRGGVLAVVGVGGSGKTALVRDMLTSRGWFPVEAASTRPFAVHVWSFYLSEDSNRYCQDLYDYVTSDAPQGVRRHAPVDVLSVVDALAAVDQHVVLILDGLETLQAGELDAPLARGQLVDQSIRLLLCQIADGQCGRTHAVVTTRVALSDLTSRVQSGYQELDVDRLSESDSLTLVRALGVQGTDSELVQMIRDNDYHALTIDLVSRWLLHYRNGLARRACELPSVEHLGGSAEIEKKAKKLVRILHGYTANLEHAERALLDVACVFPYAVLRRNLVRAFISAELTTPRTSADDTQVLLDQLISLRLFTTVGAGTEERVILHAFIREYFYVRLTPENRRRLNENALDWLRQAGARATAEDPLEHEIHVIHHLLELDKMDEAYAVYHSRIGGYLKLGWKLGAHGTGSRIMRMFHVRRLRRGELREDERRAYVRTRLDHGLYLKNLGLLEEACECFEQFGNSAGEPARERALALQNESAVEALRGRVSRALTCAEGALAHVEVKDTRLRSDCLVRVAVAHMLGGRIGKALNTFAELERFHFAPESPDFPRDVAAVRSAWLLSRLRRFDAADTTVEACRHLLLDRERLVGQRLGMILVRLDAVQLETAIASGRLQGAATLVDRVREWTQEHFDQEMVIAGHLGAAALTLAEGAADVAEEHGRKGLRFAREYGYWLYWIDLQLLLAKCAHRQGQLDRAESLVAEALSGAGEAAREYWWATIDALTLRQTIASSRGDAAVATELGGQLEALRRSAGALD